MSGWWWKVEEDGCVGGCSETWGGGGGVRGGDERLYYSTKKSNPLRGIVVYWFGEKGIEKEAAAGTPKTSSGNISQTSKSIHKTIGLFSGWQKIYIYKKMAGRVTLVLSKQSTQKGNDCSNTQESNAKDQKE